jgi:BirA family biotin operon repressor/biotin-[acetyl-CoA-carboxylase] ligase
MDLEFEVLSRLRRSENFLSGEKLAEEIGVSRMAVWKAVERLKAKGYLIEVKAKKGYLLKGLKRDVLPIYEIQHELKTAIIGRKVYCLSEVESTMDEVRRLTYEEEGLTLIAERQKAGRGRLGRNWHSPQGGVYLSVLLKPKIHPSKISCLPLMGGLIVAETLRSLYGIKAELKWPNDVVYMEKKISGILFEASVEQDIVHYVILGIGVNLNLTVKDFPLSLKRKACSVKMILGRDISRIAFLKELLKRLDNWYLVFLREGSKPIIEGWSKISATLGKMVRVKLPGRELKGLAEKLDEDGGLILRTPKGSTVKVLSGDVYHLSTYST